MSSVKGGDAGNEPSGNARREGRPVSHLGVVKLISISTSKYDFSAATSSPAGQRQEGLPLANKMVGLIGAIIEKSIKMITRRSTA